MCTPVFEALFLLGDCAMPCRDIVKTKVLMLCCQCEDFECVCRDVFKSFFFLAQSLSGGHLQPLGSWALTLAIIAAKIIPTETKTFLVFFKDPLYANTCPCQYLSEKHYFLFLLCCHCLTKSVWFKMVIAVNVGDDQVCSSRLLDPSP